MTIGIWDVPVQRATPNITSLYDSAWIQEAVDACKNAGGGIVQLGPGTFVLDDDIALDQDDVIVRGSGPATKIRNRASGEFAFVITADRCGVEDLMIDCESVGEGGVHMTTGCTRPSIRRLTISGSVDEAIKGSGTVNAQGIIEDVYIPDGAVGIEFATAFTNMRMLGVQVAATRPFNLGAGAGHVVIGAGGGMLYRDTQLTSAQVKALAAANIDLVPAPGAGYALVPVAVLYVLDRNAAYDDAAADGNLILAYKTTQTALITSEADGFIDAAADAAKWEGLPDADRALEANTALVLDNDGAEFTGDAGDVNTLSVRVYYHIVPFAAFPSS